MAFAMTADLRRLRLARSPRKTGNVIETHEQKGHFVERKPFSASPALFST